MTNNFRNWLIGIGVVFIISLGVFMFSMIMSPDNHISLFESWSIILTTITLGAGYQEYYKPDEE